MDLGLQGKKAILVGAARGIGMAIAETLAREGCDLVIAARSEDSVKDAVANLKRYGTNVVGRPVNVKKADEYKEWLEWAIEAVDGVDILIPLSSSGGGMGSEKYWTNAFEVDVMGPVRAVEAVLPKMTEQQSGSIVLIGTTSTGEAMGGPQAYNAMKASLITWGKQLALFHGKNNIRVNVVSPGPVEFEGGNWDMIKGSMEKFYQAQLRQQPTGRLGTPDEIARCVAFLASPAANWCNGSHLVVDGGFTNRTHF